MSKTNSHPSVPEAAPQNKMGTAPVFRLILSMALPAILSMLVQALYNVVDSIFVSRVSMKALSAVSLAFPLQNLMISVCVGTGVGVNSLVARRLGEKRQQDADSAATHGIVVSLLFALCFAILGLCIARPFFSLYSDDPTIIRYGVDYVSVVAGLCFGSFVQVSIEKTLQATGDMLWPMLFHLIGAVTNLILDPIMIFGLFGFPRLEVRGAAIATVAGQILAMTVALTVLLTREHKVHVRLRGFRFRKDILRDIFSVGLPSIVMQSIGSVMTAGLNGILASFSQAAVNVFGIYFKLQSFVFMPIIGLNQGVVPIIGYNYGARDRRRLMTALKYGLLLAFCIMCLGTLVFHLLPVQLLNIFDADAEVKALGVPALRIISRSFPLAAISIMLSVTFQATGNGTRSLLVSLLRQLIVLLPTAYLLSRFSLSLVWWAFPFAELFSVSACGLFFRNLYRNKIRPLDTPRFDP